MMPAVDERETASSSVTTGAAATANQQEAGTTTTTTASDAASPDASRVQAAMESLRRSSSNLGSPTRTLRITAHEQQQQQQLSEEMMMARSRPRSNPRSRTPMRYESPLEPDAFTRRSPSPNNNDAAALTNRRITIRPMAGRAVGTTVRTTIREQQQQQPRASIRSRKQGQPSQRKIRRWNNDRFAGLAAELVAASKHSGTRAADALLQAQSEAHLYRSVYDFNEHGPSEPVKKFMQDDAFKSTREHFFEGCGPLPSSTTIQHHQHHHRRKPWTADDMLNRIDPRLRRVVVRACRNSYAAAKVVELFEECILTVFRGDSSFLMCPSSSSSLSSPEDEHDGTAPVSSCCWWKDLLLQCPTVNATPPFGKKRHEQDGALHYRSQFFFHAASPTGGFHRLLLQAVCQFHGLQALSRMVLYDDEGGIDKSATTPNTKARALIVTGALREEPARFRLLQHLNEQQQLQSEDANVRNVGEQMSALRV